MFCGKGGVACESCAIVDGERCGTCQGITACYFHNDPLCQPQSPSAVQAAALPGGGAAPAVACGPDNCAGCCDASGTCRPGTHNAFCGAGGGACFPCSPIIDGDSCGICKGVVDCYFPNDPRCF